MHSPIYIALYGIMLVILSIFVIKTRRQYQVALMDNGYTPLQQRIRAHQNFTEYTPLFSILLMCLEMNHTSLIFIHLLGTIFLISRILHSYSLIIHEKYQETKPITHLKFRIFGMIGTFSSILTASILILFRIFYT